MLSYVRKDDWLLTQVVYELEDRFRRVYQSVRELALNAESLAQLKLQQFVMALNCEGANVQQSKGRLSEVYQDAFVTKEQYYDPFFTTLVTQLATRLKFFPAKLKRVWRYVSLRGCSNVAS
jgi:hypothetical protein